jgi:hypothetical protein
MSALTEPDVLAAAYTKLGELLTDDDMTIMQRALDGEDARHDAMWDIVAAGTGCTLLVQAFRRFIPRDVDRVLGGNHPLIRRVIREEVLVVAPWFSPRSRELLRERGFNYLDLTGNVLLRIARPKIHIRLEGAQQDPDPLIRRPVRLQGAGANALVRILVDFTPPYRLVDLAAASGLSNPYVSRTLDALVNDRVIERDPRNKMVTDVDWQILLKARAEHYSLVKSNLSQTYIARTGVLPLLRKLGTANDDRVLVTGSFAATEYVRIAAPTQLALYVPDFAAFEQRYGLMPADRGADVMLLKPADASQLARARTLVDGTVHIGVSQLVLDCLTGNGRLPEEGEALLEWMAENVPAWRHDGLPPRRPPG